MESAYPSTLAAYAAARGDLLERIARGLEADPRFGAAWLGGSYGRGEQDAVSDLDLFLAVEDAHSQPLCAYGYSTSAGAPTARLSLFETFGKPASIHENHHNVRPGGSFSAVLYHQPPVIVDWTLLPRRLAHRPPETLLLFDRAGIPSEPPVGDQDPPAALPLPDNAARLAERTAFFWMMAAICAKYIVRGSPLAAGELLPMLEGTFQEIATLAGRVIRPATSLPDPAARLRADLEEIQNLLGGGSASARPQVEAILRLAAGSPDG